MKRSVFSECRGALGLAQATIATNTTTNGSTVDLNGTGTDERFRSAMVMLRTTGVTDGSYVLSLEDSPDSSSWTAVAAPDVQGTVAAITSAGANSTFYLGYVGAQRYVRCKLVSSATTSGGVFSAMWVLGTAAKTPVTH
jgi:hypothetical protein